MICSWLWLAAVVSHVYVLTGDIQQDSPHLSSLPHLLCGQSFFMVLLYKPPDIFFFFIASHDPWQTQLPQHGGDGRHQPGPWKNPVLLTDTFVVPR